MNTLPNHVAIIPDGNRRWAVEQQQSAIEGHKQGAKTFRGIAIHAADRGVKYLSIWGLSLDNYTKRSAEELTGLLELFHEQFTSLQTDPEVHDRQIRIMTKGKWRDLFPGYVRQAIVGAEKATEKYARNILNIFLAYNGTTEMVEAISSIAESARRDRTLKVTPELIKQRLFTHDLPPVDLFIRTGGQPHLSAGFMMWDMADAALFFTEKLWPAFTADDFDTALAQYTKQERRFGR